MNREEIQKIYTQSLEGLDFLDVLQALSKVGVLYYYVDFISNQRIYYSEENQSIILDGEGSLSINSHFSKEEIIKSVESISNGEINYLEWIKKVCAAGVFGYFVFLVGGRYTVYLGPHGEHFVQKFPEHFPQF